jgi:tight adherence protein B
MLIVTAAAVFTAIFILLIAVFGRLQGDRQTVRDRLGRYIEPAPATSARPAATSAQGLTGWRAVVRRASRYFEWARWSRSVEHKLIQAGLPLKGAEFAAICFATAMLGAFLVNTLIGAGSPGASSILPGAVGSMIGYLLPQAYLNYKIRQRARAFNSQLGDALILIANSLRTGYSFLQAIDLVSQEMRPPLASEFARMLKEMNLGITTEDAMNNLARRVASDDLDLVVTAVLIQRQVGGNLAEVLDNIAGTIRERIRLKREIKTLTAQGRVSGLIIGILPFALAGILFMMNPKYLGTLFTHPAGQMMLAASAVGMVVGMLWIRRIVNIEF